MKTNFFKMFFFLLVIPWVVTSCFNEIPVEEDKNSTYQNSEQENGKVPLENRLNSSKTGALTTKLFVPYSKLDSARSYNFPNIQSWQMISTGQKKCYDNFGEINCPDVDDPEYGGSGAVSYGPRVYIPNGDGTVKDGVTNLLWQSGYITSKTWYEAKNYCDNLTLAGKRWRLPLTHELRSLVHYGVNAPSIDGSAFPDTPSDWFWSSKHTNYSTMNAGTETVASWIISFIDGSVEYTGRDNYYSVRCVTVE